MESANHFVLNSFFVSIDTKRAAVSSKENDIEQLLEEAEKSGLAQLDSNS